MDRNNTFRNIKVSRPTFRLLGDFFDIKQLLSERFGNTYIELDKVDVAAKELENKVLGKLDVRDFTEEPRTTTYYDNLIERIRVSSKNGVKMVAFGVDCFPCSIIRKIPRGVVLRDTGLNININTEFELQSEFNPYSNEACSIALMTNNGVHIAIGLKQIGTGNRKRTRPIVTVLDFGNNIVFIDDLERHNKEAALCMMSLL